MRELGYPWSYQMLQATRLGRRVQWLWRVFGLIAGLSLLASAAVARPTPVSGALGLQPFRGYRDACGMPIFFAVTPQMSLALRDQNGRPIIVLDPRLAAEEEAPRLVFLVAHECAHHVLLHTTVSGLLGRRASTKVVLDQELSADCWAAELLGLNGHDEAWRVMSQRFTRSGLYSPGRGYPSGVQRSSIIRLCGEAGRRRRRQESLIPFD